MCSILFGGIRRMIDNAHEIGSFSSSDSSIAAILRGPAGWRSSPDASLISISIDAEAALRHGAKPAVLGYF